MAAVDRFDGSPAITTGEALHGRLGPGRAVVTPGAVKHELELVRDAMAELDERLNVEEVRPLVRAPWARFVADWRRFYLQVGAGLVPTERAWSRLQECRRRIASWNDAIDREATRTQVGALVVTPGAIKDEIETVNAGVKQLDSDIMASNVRDAFKKAWRTFADEWKRFYDSKQSWWSRSWGATMEKATEYRKRVDEWRSALQREGGQATGPALNLPDAPGGGSLKWWAIGGLLVAGAVVGAKALRWTGRRP